MRVLLVLGRVSNLPTVWSNCLAAWLLAGGGSWNRFALVCLGATFLYTGGMFLNDAVDAAFDRRYRPERPIPSGHISARSVWILSLVWLTGGWLTFFPLGKSSLLIALALLGAIVIYDFVHKQTSLAPLLMAACRFLLYLVAASAAGDAATRAILWRATALAGYIIGLSYLARGESTGVGLVRWTVVFLFMPMLTALVRPAAGIPLPLCFAAIQLAWTFWCLLALKPRREIPVSVAVEQIQTMNRPRSPSQSQSPSSDLPKPATPDLSSLIPSGVPGLLAGIVLVDLLAAAGLGLAPLFLALFLLALVLQRLTPAT
jgi:UbiA prenyltransferase family protein